MGPHCWWWGPGWFFGAPWNMLLGALFWVAIVPRGGALRILEERYARGEINDEEFANRKRALSGT